MQHQKSRSINISDREYYKNHVPKKPILTSHDAGWQNMVLGHHRHSANEITNISVDQHLLIVPLHQTKIMINIDNCLHEQTRQAGEIVLIPANVDYCSAVGNEIEYIILAIKPQQLIHNGRDLIKKDSFELIPTFAEPDRFIYGTALALKQELETDYKGCRLYAETLLNSLNIHLLRNYCTSPIELKQYNDGLSPRKLQASIDYIQAHLAENLSLEAMAEEVSISRFYFCRLFKQSTGITPYQ